MTKPKHKYMVKRVCKDGVGWQYNDNRGMWELWHRGRVSWCCAATTESVIHDFINYEIKYEL